MSDFLHGIEVKEIDTGGRIISTPASSVVGLVGTAPSASAEAKRAFPLNTPVLVTNLAQLKGLGETGTIVKSITTIYKHAKAPVVVVRVDEGSGSGDTKTANTITNITGTLANKTGLYALLNAEAETGLKPRILIAPGYTAYAADVNTKNTAVVGFEVIAERLRAICIVDGKDTTDAAAKKYAGLYDNRRLYMVDNSTVKSDGTIDVYASAHATGAMVWRDVNNGFWWSPSNTAVKGAVKMKRAISFGYSDKLCDANQLNASKVAVITRVGTGGTGDFKLWGNRTLSSDSKWAFINVVRTVDMVYDALEYNHAWAMDRPMSAQLLQDIADGVNAYLRKLVTDGALLGGECWIDPDLNTKEALASGQLFVDFDLEPAGPLERLIFRAHRNNGYYDEMIKSIKSS